MKPFGTVVLAKVSNASTEPLAADVCWLTQESDWSFVADWKKAVRKERSPSVRDALEYAQLGCKRWRFLFRQHLTVRGLDDFKPAGEPAVPAREVGLAVAVTTDTDGERSQVVGFGFLRRSWANRLILEFLAVSPEAQRGLKGTGAALMHVFCHAAVTTGAAELWGEATEASCGFYAALKTKILRNPAHQPSPGRQKPEDIADRFVFDSGEVAAFDREGPAKCAD